MEITLYEKMSNPVEAVDRLGIMFAKSGMFGCDNENAGKMLALVCMAERKSPTDILRQYDIIGGKLRKKALASFAEFRAKGGKVKWLATGEDGKKAEAEFSFEGQTIKVAFDIEQAKKGGAIFKDGSNWVKTPGNMLRARCLSNAIAMLCPEIFAGGEESIEADDTPAPEIKLSPSPAAESPKPTPAPATVIVEAEVVGEPSSKPVTVAAPPTESAKSDAPAPVTPAPAATPEPPKAPAAAPVAELPDEMVTRIEAAIGGDHAVAAIKWLIKEGWLKHGEGLAQLSEARANRILKQTASFLRAVTGSATT